MKCLGRPSPISRLSIETLVYIASYLAVDGEQWRDVVHATQVCRAWRRVFVNEASLWTDLKDVNYADMREIERVPCCSRITSPATMHQILQDVKFLDGVNNLTKIELDLTDYGPSEESLVPYQAIALILTFAAWATPRLVEFRLSTDLITFPGGAPFFNALPRVEKMFVKSGAMPGYLTLPELLRREGDSQTGEFAVQDFALRGVTLNDPSFPRFSALASLRLFDVTIPNLYGLLSQCCAVVSELVLGEVRAQSPFNYFVSTKTALPTLFFPALTDLFVFGCTPSLWSVPGVGKTGFMTLMPALESVAFEATGDWQGAWQEISGMSNDNYNSLTSGALACLLRSSTGLTSLDLDGTSIALEELLEPLSFAPQLDTLRLNRSLTLEFIQHLPSVLPNLTELTCYAGDESPFDLRDLHRLAEAYHANPFRTHKSIEITANDYDFDESSHRHSELFGNLRDSLASISQAQLDHILDDFLLPADEWHRMRIEVLASPGRSVGTVLGSQAVVTLASERLRMWWHEKEEANAVDWFRQTSWAHLSI